MNQGPAPDMLTYLRQFLSETLPTAALTHSYLVDMDWDPALDRHRPANQELADAANGWLHHLMALWGAVLRADMGDPSAWSSIGLNLARVLVRRNETMQKADQLDASLRQDPKVQRFLSLLSQTAQQMDPYVPAMMQVIAATGWQRALTGM